METGVSRKIIFRVWASGTTALASNPGPHRTFQWFWTFGNGDIHDIWHGCRSNSMEEDRLQKACRVFSGCFDE